MILFRLGVDEVYFVITLTLIVYYITQQRVRESWLAYFSWKSYAHKNMLFRKKKKEILEGS